MSIERFIIAHNKDYNKALKEIKSGRKRTHWMWYIFPQLKGLGFSDFANFYGIEDLNEAQEYINNEFLYNHMIEICNELLKLKNNDIIDIMGEPDDDKLRSCMTLFKYTKNDCDIFDKVLEKYYWGIEDIETIKILKR